MTTPWDWRPLAALVARLAAGGPSPAAVRALGGAWASAVADGWLAAHGRFAPDEVGPPPAGLTAALADAHAWLEDRNRRFLAAHLAPLADRLPADLVGVGRAGLGWALDVYRTRRWRRPFTPAAAAGPGDLLAFHLLADELVRAGGPVARPSARRAGGLRHPAFLAAFVPGSAAATVAGRSPLTRLIYLDLFAPPPAADLAPLWAAPPEPYSHRERATVDAWQAQLARSVLAALISRPHAETVWRRADALRRLAVRRARRAGRRRLVGWAVGWGYEWWADVVRRRADAVRTNAAAERAGVPERLAGAFVRPGFGPAAAATHARLLDMLVRHVVAVEAAGYQADVRRLERLDPFADPVDVLTAGDGAVFRRAARLLLGSRPSGWHTALVSRDAVLAALTGPGDDPRLTEPRRGLRLPLQPPDDIHRPTPGSVLGGWAAAILSRLPAAQVSATAGDPAAA